MARKKRLITPALLKELNRMEAALDDGYMTAESLQRELVNVDSDADGNEPDWKALQDTIRALDDLMDRLDEIELLNLTMEVTDAARGEGSR